MAVLCFICIGRSDAGVYQRPVLRLRSPLFFLLAPPRCLLRLVFSFLCLQSVRVVSLLLLLIPTPLLLLLLLSLLLLSAAKGWRRREVLAARKIRQDESAGPAYRVKLMSLPGWDETFVSN